jgi:hypothetical protein
MTMVMTTSMRFFLFAGCIGILLASFAVQVLPDVPLLYVTGLALMGAGAMGCVLVSLPRLLNPQKPRFDDARMQKASYVGTEGSANRNAAPMAERTGQRIGR